MLGSTLSRGQYVRKLDRMLGSGAVHRQLGSTLGSMLGGNSVSNSVSGDGG